MKKILSLVLVLVMLSALTACGAKYEAADADDLTALATKVAVLEQKQKDMDEKMALSERIAALEAKVEELENRSVSVAYIPAAATETAPVEAAPAEAAPAETAPAETAPTEEPQAEAAPAENQTTEAPAATGDLPAVTAGSCQLPASRDPHQRGPERGRGHRGHPLQEDQAGRVPEQHHQGRGADRQV